MENGHLHDDKLFRAVHDRLSDYEAPYNGADWDAMSRSLDNLPKTTRIPRMQWKFSLNSILIGLAVAGLSVAGIAMASHSGSDAHAATQQPSPNNEAQPVSTSYQVSTSPPAQPQQNNVTVNSAPAADMSQPVASTETSTPSTDNQQLSTDRMTDNTNNATAAQQNTRRQKNNSKYRFADQIDPKKGFIYNTQEDQSIQNRNIKDPIPGIYYDGDNNGNAASTAIEVHKDSSGVKSHRVARPVRDTTAAGKSSIPSGEERTGFDQQ